MITQMEFTSDAFQGKEVYPFSVFRFPSLGAICCPPDVPVEIFGLQLCYAMQNDLEFINWGVPGRKYKTAIVDFTNSNYNLLLIKRSIVQWYKHNNPDLQKIHNPEFYSINFPDVSEFTHEETRDCVEALSRIIDEKQIDFIFLNGVSGYYQNNFYDLMSRLKKITVSQSACIIITHIIASVIYGDVNSDSFRAPLSHKMIRKCHLEAMSLVDWTWFITPSTESLIKKVSQSGIRNVPAGSYLYANKIVQPSRPLSISENGQEKPLFYLCKSPNGPFILHVELTGNTGS